ncbi:olfactory receptor 1361-like [Bombina bombina]|uniref:olfactory receptor 1361-like n=1 Tax=Bombina bombina TaxID=8345 RepID=UPI00235A5FE5|nr:olfactory receptor 1361-like [Bombina bombina]
MEQVNKSSVTYFLLQGLSDIPQVQLFLFISFLIIYLLTLFGNFAIVTIIYFDCKLYTPMYILLSHLSFLDICYTTVTIPKMLMNLILGSRVISYNACFTQLFFFISFGQSESFLLAVMAYDRYAAICHPLHYMDIMTHKICTILTGFSWFTGFLNSALHTGLATRLSFCSSNKVSHFFCDITPLLKLSCVNTFINEVVIFVAGVFVVFTPFLCIIISYIYIISSILKIPSVTGRYKTFSTCSSHLTVVCMFYGTVLLMYMRPSSYAQDHDKVFSVIYTFITPLLNPFIYGLRNREIKDSLKKTIQTDYYNAVLYWSQIRLATY